MALASGTKALLRLNRSAVLQCRVSLLPPQRTSPWHPRSLSAAAPPDGDDVSAKLRTLAGHENVSLLENLSLLGVDVTKARQRQPGVLRKLLTNEQAVAGFLQSKGASRAVVAGIISRYPRAITRSLDHLEQRWALWRRVFASDSEVVDILDRSPESFFRSSDNENLEKNFAFLASLGFDAKVLHRLMATAPRTLSNSAKLNRQMFEFLEDVGAEMGLSERSEQTPTGFAKAVITKNMYVLIRSTRRVRRNIDALRSLLGLCDAELLALLQGPGAEILDLSSEYLCKNFRSLQQKMAAQGCGRADVKRLVVAHPTLLYLGMENLGKKLEVLLRAGITMRQVLEKPKVLDYSTQNLEARIGELQGVGYEFHKSGIAVLDMSRKRFDARMEKLAAAALPKPPRQGRGDMNSEMEKVNLNE